MDSFIHSKHNNTLCNIHYYSRVDFTNSRTFFTG